jgi:hypothetical protein
MKRNLPALVAALALPLAACDSFYVEADQPLACLTLQPQSFTIPSIVPTPAGGLSGTWTGQSTVAIGDVLPSFILDGPPQDRKVHLVSFGITLSGTGNNLDWLQGLQVSASNGLTSTPLATYQGGLPAGSRSINLLASNPDFNLADYVNDGNLTMDFAGTATVPAGGAIPTTWTGSVNLCISATVRKTFTQMIDG